MYSVVDLFAGAGGLSLGFKQTKKYDIKVAFENDPDMQKTYKENNPDVDIEGDVCDARYKDIKNKYGQIDVVIGGPPCQGFSNANRQKNTAINANNMLVKEYLRAILELHPRAFVMENVSMLRSEVHRFYLEKRDKEKVHKYKIPVRPTQLVLLDEAYKFDGAVDIVKSSDQIRKHLWKENAYTTLNVIYKASQNQAKLIAALDKHQSALKKIIEDYKNVPNGSHVAKRSREAFQALEKYYNGKLKTDALRRHIEPAIMTQRMLNKAMEIHEHNLATDGFSDENGVVVKLRSFAVFDYLKAILTSKGYVINSKVLCAADYGVPQKRMRFFVVGIKKEYADVVAFPNGRFDEDEYRTVHDAIYDLEDIEPVTNVSDDDGIKISPKDGLPEPASSLRDAEVLRNHIVTNTRPTAMERFKALRQGQNFHALANELKTNTYTDVSRTQNTIYLRLDYKKPSGTVVNVRKSMWIHPSLDRAISVREAARLQTFPDSFVFCGTKDKQYQQVGNAVPPMMAKCIAEKLASQLRRRKKK